MGRGDEAVMMVVEPLETFDVLDVRPTCNYKLDKMA
jgi:hypothetical protein